MWLSDIVAKVENKYRTSLSTVLNIPSTALAIYEDSQEPVEDINPRYVLHLVWNPFRLWRVISLSRKGKKLAPIDVTQINWQGHSFYIIRDGNHRTAVAILQGKKTIRAKIKEKRYPRSYSLERGGGAQPLPSA